MPIYEYYCPDNHTIYQFYAKTLAQGKLTPRCPDQPGYRMRKIVSAFAVTKGGASAEAAPPAPGATESGDDARMEAAMGTLEREFSNVDENDPKAMARMMRRMADVTGEKIGGEMEEVVRKLEEGADPEALEGQLGESPGAEAGLDDEMGIGSGLGGAGAGQPEPRERRHRFKVRAAPRRDPKLYDYE